MLVKPVTQPQNIPRGMSASVAFGFRVHPRRIRRRSPRAPPTSSQGSRIRLSWLDPTPEWRGGPSRPSRGGRGNPGASVWGLMPFWLSTARPTRKLSGAVVRSREMNEKRRAPEPTWSPPRLGWRAPIRSGDEIVIERTVD